MGGRAFLHRIRPARSATDLRRADRSARRSARGDRRLAARCRGGGMGALLRRRSRRRNRHLSARRVGHDRPAEVGRRRRGRLGEPRCLLRPLRRRSHPARGRAHERRRRRGADGVATHGTQRRPRHRGVAPPAGCNSRAGPISGAGAGRRRGARGRRRRADSGARCRGVLDGRHAGRGPLAPRLPGCLRVGGRRGSAAIACGPLPVGPAVDPGVRCRGALRRGRPCRVAAPVGGGADGVARAHRRRHRRGGAHHRVPAPAGGHRARHRRRRAAPVAAAARFRTLRPVAGPRAGRGSDGLDGGGRPAPGGGALGAPLAVMGAASAGLGASGCRGGHRHGLAGRPVRDAPGRLRRGRSAGRSATAVAPARVADRTDAVVAGRVSRTRIALPTLPCCTTAPPPNAS